MSAQRDRLRGVYDRLAGRMHSKLMLRISQGAMAACWPQHTCIFCTVACVWRHLQLDELLSPAHRDTQAKTQHFMPSFKPADDTSMTERSQ
jgi:hypothetical protein